MPKFTIGHILPDFQCLCGEHAIHLCKLSGGGHSWSRPSSLVDGPYTHTIKEPLAILVCSSCGRHILYETRNGEIDINIPPAISQEGVGCLEHGLAHA
jgi:hypothetical protein